MESIYTARMMCVCVVKCGGWICWLLGPEGAPESVGSLTEAVDYILAHQLVQRASLIHSR